MLPGTRNGKSCFPECRGESHSPYCIRPIAFALLHSPYCIHPIVLCPVAFALLNSPYRIRPIAFALSHSPCCIRAIAFALFHTPYCPMPYRIRPIAFALLHSPYWIRPIACNSGECDSPLRSGCAFTLMTVPFISKIYNTMLCEAATYPPGYLVY